MWFSDAVLDHMDRLSESCDVVSPNCSGNFYRNMHTLTSDRMSCHGGSFLFRPQMQDLEQPKTKKQQVGIYECYITFLLRLHDIVFEIINVTFYATIFLYRCSQHIHLFTRLSLPPAMTQQCSRFDFIMLHHLYVLFFEFVWSYIYLFHCFVRRRRHHR